VGNEDLCHVSDRAGQPDRRANEAHRRDNPPIASAWSIDFAKTRGGAGLQCWVTKRSRWATRTIWDAPTADPHLQGQGFLLEVEAEGFPLRPGTAVTGDLEPPGTARPGVVVPEAAIVRSGDRAWAYIQIAPTQFERRQLEMTIPAARGWFVTAGFAGGDQIVVTGAQALLSEELKSQIQVRD
jgi:hypothetical protein